jgi:hypothetical protein
MDVGRNRLGEENASPWRPGPCRVYASTRASRPGYGRNDTRSKDSPVFSALWTQIAFLGPAFQPTEGTVGLHPVDRQHARAMAHNDVVFLIHRLFECPTWLPLRIREILYGSASGGSETDSLLSSTYLRNGLMRLCLLRRQSERLPTVFRPVWSAAIAFSFNPRFLIALTSAYQQRRYSLA